MRSGATRTSRRRAVTLTELLVVLVIVALLATIAVPVFVNQVQRARVATAQFEVRQIAEAQQQVALIHGFLVPIHVLNMVPDAEDADPSAATSRNDFNNLSQMSNHWLIDVSRPLGDQTGGNQLNLATAPSADARVQAMIRGWQGPFLNPKRVRFAGEQPGVPGTGDQSHDLVVDPWGNPYRMYSPFGLLGDASLPGGPGEPVTLSMSNLRLSGANIEANRFDRFAVVSYGANGVSDFVNDRRQQGDDIFYSFSVLAGNETLFQGF